MDERKNMSIAVKGGGPDMIAEEAEAEALSVLAWTGRKDSQWRAVKVKGAGRGGGGATRGDVRRWRAAGTSFQCKALDTVCKATEETASTR